MNDPDVRYNQMIAALKESNFRLTPQRVELVRIIAVSEGHPSASQLYAQIKNLFPTTSLATVYKTLTLLKELDQVYEVDLHDDAHYDGNRPQPHPHLICMKCNRIVDGDVPLDQQSLSRLEKETGFKILRQQISLFGLCADCKGEE